MSQSDVHKLCEPCLLPTLGETILPGAIASLSASSMLGAFRPEWLVIPRHVGRYLDVLDILQGNVVLFCSSQQGHVDAMVFRETLTEKVRVRLGWRTMPSGQTIRILLRNRHTRPVSARAHIQGFQNLHEPV